MKIHTSNLEVVGAHPNSSSKQAAALIAGSAATGKDYSPVVVRGRVQVVPSVPVPVEGQQRQQQQQPKAQVVPSVVPDLVEEVIAGLKSYEETRDTVMKFFPEDANDYHQRLQRRIRERCVRPIDPGLHQELTRAYHASLQDQRDLGD